MPYRSARSRLGLIFFVGLTMALAAACSAPPSKVAAMTEATHGIATQGYAIADAFDEFLAELIVANPDQPKLVALRREVNLARDRLDLLVTDLVSLIQDGTLDAAQEAALVETLLALVGD